MEDIRKDILWRVYATYLLLVALCVFIVYKAFYIQQVEGKHWRSMSQKLHQAIQVVPAVRGDVYSDDNRLLSTSVPQFDIYMDFLADGLIENNGNLFRKNVDSLSIYLARYFPSRTAKEYLSLLWNNYQAKNRSYLLLNNISFNQLVQLQQFPLVRLGRNKSGCVVQKKDIRLNPFKELAFRTIGMDRDENRVGLERRYNQVLTGVNGSRLVRFIPGGIPVPIGDVNVPPINGRDIYTNINVDIQEIAENALKNMLIDNGSQSGTVIVMEVATGKIKAMVNLGRQNDGTYKEDYNYALNPTEPGSTFKLVTLLSTFSGNKATLNTPLDLGGGEWKIFGRTIYDSEKHGVHVSNVREAFALSSNVGMAKLLTSVYESTPLLYMKYIHRLHLDTLTGIDLSGEQFSLFHKPGTASWSATTLPWMAFGYGLTISPLQSCTLYNAIANGGTLMRPYIVNTIRDMNDVVMEYRPTIWDSSICDQTILKEVQSCLLAVTTDKEGTAYHLFKDSPFLVGGKTGTALISNAKYQYKDKVYQSSFIGYFPFEHPLYTIAVVIQNNPHAKKIYGGVVAAPVFYDIAKQLYVQYSSSHHMVPYLIATAHTPSSNYVTQSNILSTVVKTLQIPYQMNGMQHQWIYVNENAFAVTTTNDTSVFGANRMPSLHLLHLKDAVALCEQKGLVVCPSGMGTVVYQSVMPMATIQKGEKVYITLQ